MNHAAILCMTLGRIYIEDFGAGIDEGNTARRTSAGQGVKGPVHAPTTSRNHEAPLGIRVHVADTYILPSHFQFLSQALGQCRSDMLPHLRFGDVDCRDSIGVHLKPEITSEIAFRGLFSDGLVGETHPPAAG